MTVLQDAIQRGLGALRAPELSIQQLATYLSIGIPRYDANTGATTSPSTVYPDVPVVFTNYKRLEIDGKAVLAEDQKAIIATRDLTPTPTVNDTITKSDSTVWSIIGILTDPAGAAWVLQIRRP